MTAFPRGNDDHGASVQLWLVIPNVVRNLGGGEISRCARNDRSELLVTDRSSLVPSGLSVPGCGGMPAFRRGNYDEGADVQLGLVIPNGVRNIGGGEISRCARNDRSELLVTDRSSWVPSGLRYCGSSRVTVQAAATTATWTVLRCCRRPGVRRRRSSRSRW